ncbi:methyltransferase [Mangrovibacter phragmitis]|uniref:Methyltransferase n=1 Tax=Mangrovibacter phragmitis TaxID=1691903 RepID=A0A1B7KYE1_9ENTR|nr:rRNA adenine N-6-methyltransferase family protein [Mangrovibacter phragmitis]OAT75027.1 methyltransferase [Mangrovibacter phragmitis]
MYRIDVLLKSQRNYIRQFIRSPRTIGTLVPSSPWLCRAMISSVSWGNITRVAELGAGEGVLTRKILTMMPNDAKLDAYEIDPSFLKTLSRINDSRLQIIPHSAELLEQRYDIIFSCLPLLSLPPRIRLKILKKASIQLTPNGSFIQFQYTHGSEKSLSRFFSWEKVFEVRNFPPAWVYSCKAMQQETCLPG